MAKTRATVTGGNKSSETGTASRLGSDYVTVTADTWQTYVTVTTRADGRVSIVVRDDGGRDPKRGGVLLRVEVSAEDDRRRTVSVADNTIQSRAMSWTTLPSTSPSVTDK